MLAACAQRLDVSARICAAFNDCMALQQPTPQREGLFCLLCRGLQTDRTRYWSNTGTMIKTEKRFEFFIAAEVRDLPLHQSDGI